MLNIKHTNAPLLPGRAVRVYWSDRLNMWIVWGWKYDPKAKGSKRERLLTTDEVTLEQARIAHDYRGRHVAGLISAGSGGWHLFNPRREPTTTHWFGEWRAGAAIITASNRAFLFVSKGDR